MQLSALLDLVPSRYVRFVLIHALLTVGVTLASVHFLPPLEPDTTFRDPLRFWGRNLSNRLEELEDHLLIVEDKIDQADIARTSIARKTWERIEEFKRHQKHIEDLLHELDARSAAARPAPTISTESLERLIGWFWWTKGLISLCVVLFLVANWPRRGRLAKPHIVAGAVLLCLHGADAHADARA